MPASVRKMLPGLAAYRRARTIAGLCRGRRRSMQQPRHLLTPDWQSGPPSPGLLVPGGITIRISEGVPKAGGRRRYFDD
jgi:hypothetical protein